MFAAEYCPRENPACSDRVHCILRLFKGFGAVLGAERDWGQMHTHNFRSTFCFLVSALPMI